MVLQEIPDFFPAPEDFWLKVVEMLQTNWAVVVPSPAGVEIVFVHDRSGIFDRIALPDASEAKRQLRINGFSRYADHARAQGYLIPPSGPYHEAAHPNGPIYSSGRFWGSACFGSDR
jgi:hypothetical protein